MAEWVPGSAGLLPPPLPSPSICRQAVTRPVMWEVWYRPAQRQDPDMRVPAEFCGPTWPGEFSFRERAGLESESDFIVGRDPRDRVRSPGGVVDKIRGWSQKART